MSTRTTEGPVLSKGTIMDTVLGQELFMPIKWRLAAVMADRELDYKDVSRLTGFHEKTVNRHKNMRVMPGRLEDTTLLGYCKALDCQPGDLLVYVPESQVRDRVLELQGEPPAEDDDFQFPRYVIPFKNRWQQRAIETGMELFEIDCRDPVWTKMEAGRASDDEIYNFFDRWYTALGFDSVDECLRAMKLHHLVR